MVPDMRTTTTIDPDVFEQLKSYARSRNLSFKAALNHLIRAGLVAERGGMRAYTMPTHSMKLRPGIDLTHALRLADSLEDEEIVRKLESGRARGKSASRETLQ
jgi:hypothetical protein